MVFLNLRCVVNEDHIQEKVHGKSLLKIGLTSSNVILFPFQVPNFMHNHLSNLALKHLFWVNESGFAVCFLRGYVILTLICLIFFNVPQNVQNLLVLKISFLMTIKRF